MSHKMPDVAEFARIRTLDAIRLNSGESSYDFSRTVGRDSADSGESSYDFSRTVGRDSADSGESSYDFADGFS